MKIFKPIGIVVTLLVVVSAFVFITNGNTAPAKETVYKIGDRGPAGGWIIYDKGNKSDGWRYLEAAPEDQAQRIPWGCTGKATGATGTSIGTGKANTAAILQACSDSEFAAKAASNYRGGGKSDWFLPSKDELNLMHLNLAKDGKGGFIGRFYWSSSETRAAHAWYQWVIKGTQEPTSKNYPVKVRAIRAF